MALSLTQTALVRVTAGQAVTNNLLRLLALSPSVSISGSVGTADLAAGAVTAAKATPGAYFFTDTAGVANTYTLSLNPALAALANGALVVFKLNATNTSASTLNVNGLGAVALTRNGAGLMAGDLIINRCYMAVYSSTGPSWDIVSQVGNPGPRYAVSTGSANAYVFTSSGTGYATPTTATSLRGELISFRANAGNSGPTTLAVDALGTKPIEYPGQRSLQGGEISTGDVVMVTWNSLRDAWQLVGITAAKPPAIIGACRNLIAFNNVATPDSKVDITADEVIVKHTTNGLPVLLETVSVTIDMAVSGANGLDTGAATNIWYYLWIIWNGTTTAGLISASATAPNMPAGYTHRALVGSVKRTAGVLDSFWQQDRKTFTAVQNIFTAKTLTGSYAALAAGDLTAFQAAVPPIARRVQGNMGGTATEASMGISAVKDDGTADTSSVIGQCIAMGNSTGTAVLSFMAGSDFDVPLRGGTSNYNVQVIGRAAAGAINRLNITGYII